ncbi:C4-dicarboxylate ABC transporter permease [Brevibacillus sp. LEMMJ03]|uniref:Tripartite tricarboxylate transporter permease n=1 Tax=Brevibacillus thermoruber TaxID=33942 RepID=A0A9X3Z582_9BACL|nr:MULTISPECIES: tripartite tricarboxylate transporter permease [Brevibacillus]MDA5110375.1 tripartite tricarboxylate transporter permease [Brevibacillus thermoruber]TRY27650.1 C4-dicarboxylate ABC transporter permease [Brevibacillus sp. LEMMJ03]
MLDMFLNGLSNIFTDPFALVMSIVGVAVGIIVGALPGLTATMGVALVLPLTFGMEPVAGLLLLSGVYFGGVYGGSITAILLKTPGTPAAAATALDGYALAQKGMAGKALGVATLSSFTGGTLSIVILMFLSPILANIALEFSAPETFALAVFGLSIIASISGKSLVKGLIAGMVGLLLAMVGLDPILGFPRFTGGIEQMVNGVPFIPIMIGLFAASEAFKSLSEMNVKEKVKVKIEKILPSWAELRRLIPTLLRSTGLGTFIGIIPGAGADIAAFVSYNEAKRFSKDKDGFGKGKIEGVSSCEAGANACTGGALVPLLTLGIPGDAVTAVMLGALMVQGLQPGPLLFKNNGDLVYTLFIGMIICYAIMLLMGLFASRYFARVVEIPREILTPIILVLCIVGSYAINNSFFDVIIMAVAGVVGYFMQKYDFPASPIVLALILGPMAESQFRRALALSNGSYDIFYTRPIPLVLLLLSAITLLTPIVKAVWQQRKRAYQ